MVEGRILLPLPPNSPSAHPKSFWMDRRTSEIQPCEATRKFMEEALFGRTAHGNSGYLIKLGKFY